MVESFEIVNILILGNRQQQTKINKRLISRVDHGEGGGGRGGGGREVGGKNGRIIKTCKRTCILQNELFYSRPAVAAKRANINIINFLLEYNTTFFHGRASKKT